MKILKKLKYNLIFMFITPFLITDKHLNKTSKEIFSLYMLLYEPYNKDWRYRKLTSFCLYKGLPVLILASINGTSPVIKTNIDFDKLKTIIGMSDFKKYYFNNISEKWLKKKWYKNDLPIVCKIKKNFVVIDGNHRMCQQIYHNEIKYNYIEIQGGWFKLFLKILLRRL